MTTQHTHSHDHTNANTPVCPGPSWTAGVSPDPSHLAEACPCMCSLSVPTPLHPLNLYAFVPGAHTHKNQTHMHANATARTEVREQQSENTSGLLFSFLSPHAYWKFKPCRWHERKKRKPHAIMCKLSLLMLMRGLKSKEKRKTHHLGGKDSSILLREFCAIKIVVLGLFDRLRHGRAREVVARRKKRKKHFSL